MLYFISCFPFFQALSERFQFHMLFHLNYIFVCVFFTYMYFHPRRDTGIPKALMLAKLGNSEPALAQALRDGDVHCIRDKGKDMDVASLNPWRSDGPPGWIERGQACGGNEWVLWYLSKFVAFALSFFSASFVNDGAKQEPSCRSFSTFDFLFHFISNKPCLACLLFFKVR